MYFNASTFLLGAVGPGNEAAELSLIVIQSAFGQVFKVDR